MGLFGGRRIFGRDTEEERLLKELEASTLNPKKQIKKLPSLREQAQQQIAAKRLKQTQQRQKNFAIARDKFDKGSFEVGRSVGQFGAVAAQARPDFTREQEALQSMFGRGEKIWGYGEPVTINNDLNPSKRGDFSTARLFGF